MFRYLLSVCLFLLGGYGHLSAHSQHESICHASQISIPAHTGSVILHNDDRFSDQSAIISTGIKYYRETIVLVEKEEDDDSDTFKKHLKSNYSSNLVFFSQASGSYFAEGKKFQPFSMHYACASYSRYLLLQVFRI